MFFNPGANLSNRHAANSQFCISCTLLDGTPAPSKNDNGMQVNGKFWSWYHIFFWDKSKSMGTIKD